MADSNPPADQTAASDDLPLSPADHHALGHAYLGAAADALDHAAGHFTAAAAPASDDSQPDDSSGDDGDSLPGSPEADGDEADRSAGVDIQFVTPAEYLTGVISTDVAGIATVKPAGASRAFPGSAQQRSLSAITPATARTIAAMRGQR